MIYTDVLLCPMYLSVHPSHLTVHPPDTYAPPNLPIYMYICLYILISIHLPVYFWLRRCATNRKVRSQLVSLEFFIDIKSFRSHYDPGVDSTSNRNEYRAYFLGGKGGRCVRLTTHHHPVPLS